MAASRTAQETVNSFTPELHSNSTNPIWRAAHTIRQVSYVLLSAARLLCRTIGIFAVQRKKCTNKTKRLTQPHIKYKAELGLQPRFVLLTLYPCLPQSGRSRQNSQ